MRSTVAALLLLVLAAGVLTGCGESKADKAKSQVCDARDDIGKQVDALKGLTITTATTEKITDSLNAIQSDLKKIADATGDLSAERKKDVQAANDEFKSTMSQITADFGSKLSIQDLATQAKAALQQLADSYANTFGKLSC
jgi:phosphoglycerate-specific signal transduction histidine kinase